MLSPDVYRAAYGLEFFEFQRGQSDAASNLKSGLYLLRSLKGRKILSTSPYLTDSEDLAGPIANAPEFKEFKTFVKNIFEKTGAEYALIKTRNAALAETLLPEFSVSNQFLTSVLDLSGGREKIWNEKLHSKRRRQVQKGYELKPRFEFGRSPKLVEDFFSVFVATQTDLGTPVHSKTYIDAILNHHETAEVVVAYVGEKPSAAALLFYSAGSNDRRVFHPYTGTLREYFPSYLNATLYWEIILRALSKNVSAFDMGRSFRGSGVQEFKKYWGVEEVDLYYCYLLAEGAKPPVYDSWPLKFATKVWSHLPKNLARALGPKFIRSVP